MNTRTNLAPSMARTAKKASQLLQIPAVRELVEAEESRRLESARQARLACMKRISEIEEAMLTTASELSEASTAFKAAEVGLEEFRVKVILAHQKHSQASSAYSNACAELNKLHGEGELDIALRRVAWLIQDCDRALVNLQANQFVITPFGRKIPIHGVSERIKARQDQRVKAVQAHEALQGLLRAPIAPELLIAQVEDILAGLGMAERKTEEEALA